MSLNAMLRIRRVCRLNSICQHFNLINLQLTASDVAAANAANAAVAAADK